MRIENLWKLFARALFALFSCDNAKEDDEQQPVAGTDLVRSPGGSGRALWRSGLLRSTVVSGGPAGADNHFSAYHARAGGSLAR